MILGKKLIAEKKDFGGNVGIFVNHFHRVGGTFITQS